MAYGSCLGDNLDMSRYRPGDLVFYDSRSAEERNNIMSTAPYTKVGCEVLAVEGETATLKRLGGAEVYSAVPFEQIEPQ